LSELERTKILVAAGNVEERSDLCGRLGRLGHLVVAQTGSGREAVCLTRRLVPDLAIIDIDLPDICGLEASRQIDAEGLCPILLLNASGDPAAVREACSVSAIQVFLVKPVREGDLDPVIGLAVARYRRMETLSQLSRRIQLQWRREVALSDQRVSCRTDELC